MSGHTQTPWNLDDAPDSNYGCQIAANTKVKAKRVVCRLGGPDREANAAHIVKCVNAFPDLVKALEPFANGIVTPDGVIVGLMREDVTRARAILALVSAAGDSK